MAFKPVLAHDSCVLDIAGFGEIGEINGSYKLHSDCCGRAQWGECVTPNTDKNGQGEGGNRCEF